MENEHFINHEELTNSSETDEENDLFEIQKTRFLPSERKTSTLTDRYNLVYIVFLLFGLCSVIPWNFFITAEVYWMYKLRNTSNPNFDINNKKDYTELQTAFGSYLSIASMIPANIFLFINTVISSKVSHQIRIYSSVIIMLMVFISTTVLTKINTDTWQKEFFIVTIISVIFINGMSGLFQGSIMGVCNAFPNRYMQSLMNGQCIGAVFANLANILSIAIGYSPQNVGFIYFLIGVLTIILTLLMFYLLKKLDYYQNNMKEVKDTEDRAETLNVLFGQNNNSLCYVFKKTWIYGFSAFLIYAETLAVFPAVTVLVVSFSANNGSPITNDYFTPVVCFLLYNLSDLTGRVVSGFLQKPSPGSLLLPVCSVLRCGFILIIMLCNAQPRHNLPVIFNSDVDFVIIIVMFGLTNGYLINLSVLHAQRNIEIEYRQTAGGMMAFYLGFGLSAGALLSNTLIRQL